MTNHEPPSPSRRLAQRIAGFVGGLIGLTLWYVLWQSFTATTSAEKLADMAGPAFVLIVTTSALGCILLIGMSASWLTGWATRLTRSRA